MWCYGMNNKINSYVLKCISNDTCLQARMTFAFALNYLADAFILRDSLTVYIV